MPSCEDEKQAAQVSEQRKLERILTEIDLRERHEDRRHQTVESKLTSTLAVLPIVITLSTSAFFLVIPIAASLGLWGKILSSGLMATVVLFAVAALFAFSGLHPKRGRYSAVGLLTVEGFTASGTYDEMLRKMIDEHAAVVRSDKVVNEEKIDIYVTAAFFTTLGISALCIVALALFTTFIINPAAFMHTDQMTVIRQEQSPGVSPSIRTSGPTAAHRLPARSLSDPTEGPRASTTSTPGH